MSDWLWHNIHQAMVAMTTLQGTAVTEAALCTACDSPQLRQALEARAPGDAVPGSWVDCSGNDYLLCSNCGLYDEDTGWNDEGDRYEDFR